VFHITLPQFPVADFLAQTLTLFIVLDRFDPKLILLDVAEKLYQLPNLAAILVAPVTVQLLPQTKSVALLSKSQTFTKSVDNDVFHPKSPPPDETV
tara:strand:- start:1364 stop:1651 length:288 start_codon:yes stop_codon:yes gene_type:complete